MLAAVGHLVSLLEAMAPIHHSTQSHPLVVVLVDLLSVLLVVLVVGAVEEAQQSLEVLVRPHREMLVALVSHHQARAVVVAVQVLLEPQRHLHLHLVLVALVYLRLSVVLLLPMRAAVVVDDI